MQAKTGEGLILQVYGRQYCHLCTDMLEALKAHPFKLPFSIEWMDLDDHEEWESLYGEHIPVLKWGELEICRHRFNAASLDAFLARFS